MSAKRLLVTLIFAVESLALFVGCHKDDCVECLDGASAVRCYVGVFPQVICGVDATTAAAQCLDAGGSYVIVNVCADHADGETGADSGGNQSWDPSLSVKYDSETGEYVIDRDALNQLKQDPSPLYGGTTKLREVDGYFQVAAAGGLAKALGWRLNDTLLDLDGYNLQGLAEFAEAYTMLESASEFQLTVERDRTAVVLRYRVE